MLKEFKEFIMRGNVMDLAVGVIIGAAFGKIVTSVVDDLIMPPIGKLLGNADFANLYLPLSGQTAATLEEAKKTGPVIAYGNFINTVVQFLIVALVIFLVVRAVNRLMRKKAAADEAPAPTKTEILLEEIRDLMRGRV